MPARLFDELTNWAQGVNTSGPPDSIPVGASPRGYNTALFLLGENSALVGSRRGAQTRNPIAVTGSAGIIGGFQFKPSSGTKYNLLVSDTGRLDLLNTNDTLTTVNATAFTTGVHYPIFAVANDLCFIVNDVDQKVFDGTVVRGIGLARPAAPVAAAAAGGTMAAETWDVALAYYNSATGNESSLSNFTTVTLAAANLSIDVSWADPVGVDLQITHVRVYLRRQTAGANAYRVVAGATAAPDATHGGFAPATLLTTLDVSATQYAAFISLAPSITENNPPAAGLKFPCAHAQRVFMADSGNVYYSNIRNGTPYPEAFNPNNVQPVNPDDGDTIVGLFSAFERLFIFKRFAIYEIVGTDPNSWQVNLVTSAFGLSTMRSLIFAGDNLYWWAGDQGPTAYAGAGSPVSLGKTFLSDTIAADMLNHQGLTSVSVGLDEDNETIVWAVPEFGGTRNTLLLPFNYSVRRFVASVWNPFDVYSLWSVETSDHLKRLYLGNYGGQAFQWWAADNDGVPAATTTGGTAGVSTSTTLVDLDATFATTGAGLKERFAYAISSDRLTIQRRRITANTATELTVTPAWTSTPNSSYTYVVGAIDFQTDTPWLTGGAGFIKKRFEFLLAQLSTLDIGVMVDIDLFVSLDDTAPKRTKRLALNATGGLYDAATSIYDSTTYAGSSVTYGKLRCATVGRAWKARIRNCAVNQTILLHKVAMQSIPMSIKS